MPPIGEIILKPVWDGKRKYEVVEDIIYVTTYGDFKVKKGFVTDLASTPKCLQSWFPKDGKYLEAAILHDWLYYNRSVDRKTADKVFRYEMKKAGVSYWKRNAFFWTVRMFGGVHRRNSK